MTVETYDVEGMTCAHCVRAVTAEVSALNGVTAVAVDLRPGRASIVMVTSESPLTHEAVAAAVDEAGYDLIGASPDHTAHDPGSP